MAGIWDIFLKTVPTNSRLRLNHWYRVKNLEKPTHGLIINQYGRPLIEKVKAHVVSSVLIHLELSLYSNSLNDIKESSQQRHGSITALYV